MFRLLDRYVLRETLSPVVLSLLVFTFLTMIDPIMRQAQDLMARGVDGWTIVQLMLTLVPQGLGITIPMAVLSGLLMGLGRLSGDREIVVMQACGVSIYRLLRPVLVLAVAAAAATCYTLVVLLPDSNQAFREIVYRTVAAGTANDIKARAFYQGLPGMVLYVNEVDVQGTGWSGVFLADTRDADAPVIYVADEGRIVLDPANRQVDIVLASGAAHDVDRADPGTYNVNRFDEIVLGLDADEVFEAGTLPRGLPEMTIAELRERAAAIEASGASPHNPIMQIHQKFSFPVACLVFGFIGLGLGVTTRRDGKLASFALGIGVIFAYYILMYGGQGLARGALLSPHWAVWICNIVLGAFGVALLVWRARFGERRFLPALPRRRPPSPPQQRADAGTGAADAGAGRGVSLGSGIGWGVSLLDRYVAKQYLKLVTLSFVGLLGIFYIVTFFEIADRLFRGDTTLDMVLEYFWYATPQFVYYVLPISALVATLITVGLFTKTSELTVMKACGISLYRASLPLFLFALAWSGALFGMSESFLADANRRANELRRVIRGGAPEYVDILQRRWLMDEDGTIYNYAHFDPTAVTLNGVTAYRFAEDGWRLAERVFAETAVHDAEWRGRDVWVRKFGADRSPGAFEAGAQRPLPLASPASFATERPDAERMNYRELDRYIGELSASGFDVVPLRVELQRKLSFPLVTLILTLIAVPFAVTMGRHGALSGIGIGLMLALSYWVVVSIFAAVGSAGILTPLLAAWAPNVLFGGSAVYLLLAART